MLKKSGHNLQDIPTKLKFYSAISNHIKYVETNRFRFLVFKLHIKADHHWIPPIDQLRIWCGSGQIFFIK